MVLIKDEGSHFDAPLSTVWEFLQGEMHGAAHVSTRNQHVKPVGENVVVLSMEQNMNGQWVKVVNRITALPPLGVAIEVLEGPMAGTKLVNIYTPKGNKTGIDVYGEFMSPQIPPAQLEGAVRANLQQVFDEDSAAIHGLVSKK
ncbi:MAG: hypothetical protein L3K02_00240 [Thermoplasmata archaeon]|nr:hypothetical protein [Thermoplasmata archaeon]